MGPEQTTEHSDGHPASCDALRWRISGMETCRAPSTRREVPAAALRHLFTRYEIWSAGTAAAERSLWVLPGEARLVVTKAEGCLSARIGNRRYDALPQVVLFGPTSRAARLVAQRGCVVTIGLSALGWAGLVGRSAAALGDRVVAAADVFDTTTGLVAALASVLEPGAQAGADTGADAGNDRRIADRLDAVLGAARPMPCVDEPLVVGLTGIIADGGVCVAQAAGEQLGVASHLVRRSALRHFGYPPKVLLNRRRFVHALERMILAERGYSEAARHGYFDASHFIRDAKRFLGMTPRRFLALTA